MRRWRVGGRGDPQLGLDGLGVIETIGIERMPVAVAAMENLALAMKALAASTAALESDNAVAEHYVQRAPDGTVTVGPGPTRPETPRLLPVVAQAWPGLMVALRDERTAAVEAALALLASTIHAAGGSFLSRRFNTEAWPLLVRLLEQGTAHAPLLTRLDADLLLQRRKVVQPMAPSAIGRVQLGVLRCLTAVCEGAEAGAAVRGLLWGFAQAAAPFLSGRYPKSHQDAAALLLLGVARLDSDTVWLLLHDLQQHVTQQQRLEGSTILPSKPLIHSRNVSATSPETTPVPPLQSPQHPPFTPQQQQQQQLSESLPQTNSAQHPPHASHSLFRLTTHHQQEALQDPETLHTYDTCLHIDTPAQSPAPSFLLPSLQSLLPPMSSRKAAGDPSLGSSPSLPVTRRLVSGWMDTSLLAKECGAHGGTGVTASAHERIGALLAAVEQLPCAWHEKVDLRARNAEMM
ncbi:MAG: hypothetical protein WDW38_011049 [Sanguina aurantia]